MGNKDKKMKTNDKLADSSISAELKDLVIVSKEEGKILGKVSHVFISTDEKKIIGLSMKEDFWGNDRHYIPIESVESIGEDIVLIKSELSCYKVSDFSRMKGTTIDNLLGHEIVTRDGKHLGEFTDAKFAPKDWSITGLFMNDAQLIDIKPEEISIGFDKVIVPTLYKSKIKKRKKKDIGILNRFFNKNNHSSHSNHKNENKSSQQLH